MLVRLPRVFRGREAALVAGFPGWKAEGRTGPRGASTRGEGVLALSTPPTHTHPAFIACQRCSAPPAGGGAEDRADWAAGRPGRGSLARGPCDRRLRPVPALWRR